MYERKILPRFSNKQEFLELNLNNFYDDSTRERESFLKERWNVHYGSISDVVSPRNNNNDDDIKGTKCRVKRNPADVQSLFALGILPVTMKGSLELV